MYTILNHSFLNFDVFVCFTFRRGPYRHRATTVSTILSIIWEAYTHIYWTLTTTVR